MSGVPISVLLARLSAVLQTVALHLNAGHAEQAATELQEARKQVEDLQGRTRGL